MLQRAAAGVTYVDATASVCAHALQAATSSRKGLPSSDEGRGDDAQA